ncbi:hypothetical protein N7509_014072 [Penicillium cosmopolitanum]|uniref:Dickkopf N-terminal cysteine-rich domain-containing protein n=1 Tax=Penicillium cosmopolitanum TaxID=1131564 RepID=A0A9W9V7P1_9EURO|nr:uncharacterized protein N7509_014072 [Penicillium cosmopolitanum]KAJ5369460.1 hypothetical protein N7509_014072 [Penicillium cosmopolitanum]
MRLSLCLITSLFVKSVVSSPSSSASASVARRDDSLQAAGDPCFDNEKCASGICLDFICRHKDIEARCYIDDECQSSECMRGQCTPLKNGKVCAKDYDCESQFCSDSICSSALGKTCTTSPGNDSYEDCHGYNCSPEGTCVEYSYLDDSCQADWQCRVGQCLQGNCKYPTGTKYSKCSGSNECNDGLICKYVFGEKQCESGTAGEAGADCKHDNHCNKGLECLTAEGSGDTYCGKGQCKVNGSFCLRDSSCCSEKGCILGVCAGAINGAGN